ncbi:MAG: nucleotidyltransferase domain-containing protein [Chloroflexi bacterium]|nr:MAG: nucleotidyltransferase domain-containing protein [Chloroflexota bacterium]
MGFDTSLWDKVLARRRAALERERRALLDRVLRLLDEHGARYGIRRAYIFGSITRPGCFMETSDVDIGVEEIDPERFCEAIGHFASFLGREVDLIELQRCPFAHRIRERGILWTGQPSSS